MNGAWAYDRIAEFYDDDMARNADGRDVAYYRQACLAVRGGCDGRILELGCGTGRITLALAASGLAVLGIDRSVPMLRVLQRKAAACARPPLVAAMDMGWPGFAGPFAAILCPFSAFTYLTAAADRDRALGAIRGALAPNARFILDAFIPDPRVEAAAGQEIFDYRRQLADGTWLERRKTVTPDREPGVNRIVRRYGFCDPAGRTLRQVVTESRQKSYRPDELIAVVQQAGFRIAGVTADFTGAPLGPGSRTVVIEAAPG
ncbi:MAG TPA: class I SAM-dependent methyltransferase [Stellaceae bacterium]|nr:class I SAM-dependent methyltransferase [Stellaceae bacterium]